MNDERTDSPHATRGRRTVVFSESAAHKRWPINLDLYWAPTRRLRSRSHLVGIGSPRRAFAEDNQAAERECNNTLNWFHHLIL